MTVVFQTSDEGGVGRPQQAFKPCMTLKEGRRSRDETTLQLRKARKHNQMMKRRCSAKQLQANDNTAFTNNAATANSSSDSKSESLTGSAEEDTLLKLLEIVQVFQQRAADPFSCSHEQLYETIKKIRKVLSETKNPPVEEIITSGIVNHIAKLLSQDGANPPTANVAFEAAWVLTNIAATKYAYVVADSGAIPDLTKLLIHDNPSVREQSAWCLGNLAADSTSQRDNLLKVPGLVDGMVRNLKDPFNEELLKNVAWSVSNLCRGKPQPAFDDVRPFVDALVHVLECCELSCSNIKNKADARVDAVWAISYINDGCNNDSIDALIQRGAVPTLMKLVMDFGNERTLMIATVRSLGNFVAGTDSQTDAVLSAGFLKWSMQLLQHRSKAIQKDTCWILSNVAAGSKHQIDQLFDTVADYGLMKKLVYMAGNTNWEIRKEALYAVCNAITNGSDEQAKILVNMNIINIFSRQLANWDDARVLLAILEAIEKLLVVSERYGLEYDILLEENQGLDMLEDLQNHRNVNVYDSVINIIVKYFKDDDEDDVDQNVAPIVHEDEFSFGVSQLPSKKLFASPEQNNEAHTHPTVSFHFGGSMASNVEAV